MSFDIHLNILLSDGASEQDKDTKNIERNVTDSHDAFIALNGGDNPFTIGDNDSNVSIDGRVISRAGNIDVNGSNIHLYEEANKNQDVAVTSGSSLNFGSDTTENLQLDGGFLAEGGNPTGSALKGKNIIIDAADGHNALMSLSQKVTVGDDATNYLGVNGEVFSHGGEQGGVVLNLKDGAQWHFAGDSTVTYITMKTTSRALSAGPDCASAMKVSRLSSLPKPTGSTNSAAAVSFT